MYGRAHCKMATMRQMSTPPAGRAWVAARLTRPGRYPSNWCTYGINVRLRLPWPGMGAVMTNRLARFHVNPLLVWVVPALAGRGHHRLSVLGSLGYRTRPEVADHQPGLVADRPGPSRRHDAAGSGAGVAGGLGRVLVAAAGAESRGRLDHRGGHGGGGSGAGGLGAGAVPGRPDQDLRGGRGAGPVRGQPALRLRQRQCLPRAAAIGPSAGPDHLPGGNAARGRGRRVGAVAGAAGPAAGAVRQGRHHLHRAGPADHAVAATAGHDGAAAPDRGHRAG